MSIYKPNNKEKDKEKKNSILIKITTTLTIIKISTSKRFLNISLINIKDIINTIILFYKEK